MTRRSKKNIPPARLKVVCYARDGDSAEVERLRAYASLYDLEIEAVVHDLPTAIAALRSGPGSADCLLVDHLSRIGATVSSVGAVIGRYFMGDSPLRLFCARDQLASDTATGRMILNMIWSCAEWEREVAAEGESRLIV